MRAALALACLAGCDFHRLPDLSGDAPDAPIDAPGPEWPFKRVLTIDNTTLSAHAAFPLLVVLNGNRINYASARPDGHDLRFTDAAGGALPHELERWDQGGTSFVWVGVPTIAANATTDIVMLYGNSKAADAQRAADVWDADYVGVWHLVDGHDSTGALTSTNEGATPTDGRIGPALAFSGTGQYINTGTAENLTRWTLEAWIRPSAAAQSGATPSGPINRYPNYQVQWNCGDVQYCNTANLRDAASLTIYETGFGNVQPLVWSYIAATHEEVALRTYLAGAPATTQVANVTSASTTIPATLGGRTDLNGFYTGGLDEVRISRIHRSPGYLAAQFRSMTDAYVSFGPELPNQ